MAALQDERELVCFGPGKPCSKGNGLNWRYADRPNAAKRLSLYIVVRVLESEAFAIPESQPDAIVEGLEKAVLAVASWIGNAKALDLVKQVIS